DDVDARTALVAATLAFDLAGRTANVYSSCSDYARQYAATLQNTHFAHAAARNELFAGGVQAIAKHVPQRTRVHWCRHHACAPGARASRETLTTAAARAIAAANVNAIFGPRLE